MDRGVGDADRTHQSELGLHEQILQRVFGDRGQRAIHAQRAGAMAHGVELEIAERDFLHFAIGRMVVDPVLVAAKAVPGVQNRRVLVGDPRQFIEPAARQRAEAIEMRLQPPKIIRLQIQTEKIAQAAIDSRRNSARRNPARCDRRRERHPLLQRCRTISVMEARACLTSLSDRMLKARARDQNGPAHQKPPPAGWSNTNRPVRKKPGGRETPGDPLPASLKTYLKYMGSHRVIKYHAGTEIREQKLQGRLI